MKNLSRFLSLGTLMLLLLSILIVSCQKTELEPVKEELTHQAPEFQISIDNISAECNFFFSDKSSEEEEEEDGFTLDPNTSFETINFGEMNATPSVAGDYCNYVIVEVMDKGKGDCGPETMDGFCVSCPNGSCKFEGTLWSPNGYRARAIRFQPVAGSSCTACNEGVVYPRG